MRLPRPEFFELAVPNDRPLSRGDEDKPTAAEATRGIDAIPGEVRLLIAIMVAGRERRREDDVSGGIDADGTNLVFAHVIVVESNSNMLVLRVS